MRKDRIPLIVLALLPFVLFAPVTFMWQVFSFQDIQAYFYPYHLVPAKMLAAGQLPLWNPYVFCGIPLLGDGQTALFYPPNWLFFVLPPETALNLVVLLQFSIAGVGMFLFARRLGLSSAPATVAALAYMFGGSMTARVVHLSIMSGAALLPAIFLCLDRLLEADPGRTGRWYAATALAVAMQALAGHPQIPIYTALAAVLFAIARTIEHRASAAPVWRPLARLAGAYVLGYSLAAIQLVPWIEFARLSTRAAGASYEFVFGTSTAGAEWLLYLFPYLLGAPESSVFATGPLRIEQAVRIRGHSAYVGLLPLALAAVGVGHLIETIAHRFHASKPPTDMAVRDTRRRRMTLSFLVLVLLLGVLIAAGWHTPFGRVLYVIPALGKLRAIERALVLASFALALLAGFGLQRAVERTAGRTWLILPAALIIALPGLFIAYAYMRPTAPLLGVPARDLARLSLRLPHSYWPLLLAASAALLLSRWSRSPAGRWSRAIAIAVVLVDLGVYATSFTSTVPRRLYRVQPQVVRAFAPDGSLFRKATMLTTSNDLRHKAAQHVLAMSWGMVYGIEDVNGFNSLQPRRYTDYLFGQRVGDVSYGFLRDERLLQAGNPVLSSLNVQYVLVPTGERVRVGPHLNPIFENIHVRMYENTLNWPRAYFAERVRAEPDPRALLRHVTALGFDGRREALVEDSTAPALPAPSGGATVRASRPGPNELEVVTTTTEPRFLVVSEMFFPGWRASVDGVETRIYRTNYLFRGLVVPAGRHTVRFEYRPGSVVAGATITAITTIVLTWLLARGRRERADGADSRQAALHEHRERAPGQLGHSGSTLTGGSSQLPP